MKKILILESDPYLIRVYSATFSNMGIDSVIPSTGPITVPAIIKEMPDVILFEINRPEQDGFQVLENLNKNEQTRSIPVVVLTSLLGNENRSLANTFGINKYFIKSETTFFDVSDYVKKLLEN
jgi:CheY-like chemotaxis protein